MDAFDGAGKPYKSPSFRCGLAMLVTVIVGVALAWLIYSAALNDLDHRSLSRHPEGSTGTAPSTSPDLKRAAWQPVSATYAGGA